MPWGRKTVKEMREEFVRRALNKEKSKSALCREYGISRPTGDKWIKRYQNGEPMEDQSKRPFRSPRKTNAETEEKIVALRKAHPAIGAKKLKRMLENQGDFAPAYSTINTILHHNGLITSEASRAATPCIRFEMAQPNDMWQADFKGHFAMKDGKRCHPLTIIDDHSRNCVCLDAKDGETYEGVRKSLIDVFVQYGLPSTLLCDNGNPWGTSQSTGYTQFEIWLMELGILTKHCSIRHPQTQGKDERYNGTLKRELLKYRQLENLCDAQKTFDEYRKFYNHKRPHHALDLDTPSQHYAPSARKLPGKIREWEYSNEYTVRTVKETGYLTFGGQGYFLSESLGGKHVGILECGEGNGLFKICYREFCIAKLDTDNRVLVAKRAHRLP
jgi:Transposase and inactivated derivatives